MKSKVYDIITDALEKAHMKFDTDGENIWVDPPEGEEGRTVSVNVMECEDADCETPQQQEPTDATEKPPQQDDANGHRFMVSIHADMTKLVEVAAPDEATAEAIVNARWMNDEIRIGDLSLAETKIDVTYKLD